LIFLQTEINQKSMDVDAVNQSAGSGSANKSAVAPTTGSSSSAAKPFVLKKWNLVAMWSWDVQCDTCAICRIQVMDACSRCQSENNSDSCVVVWGNCSHSFHNCCMSLWVKKNNRCPLCQKEWIVDKIGR
uniref:RING-box protein 2 n=2 Tax=Macrostomum lignano TaxID=282301 RepID=A0A1I8GD12_9PLAT